MSHLQIAATVAAGVAVFSAGVFVGCLVNGDRKETGGLAIAFTGVCAAAAVAFVAIGG